MIGIALISQHEKGFWQVDFFNVPPGEWKNSEELWPPDGFITRATREKCILDAKKAFPDYQLYELDGECECDQEEIADCADPDGCGMYWTEVEVTLP